MPLKKIITAQLLLFPLVCTASSYSHVSYRSDFTSTAYVIAGISASQFEFDESDFRYSFGDGSLSNSDTETDSTGLRFGFGMPLNDSLAVELSYINLGDLSGQGISNGSHIGNGGFNPGQVKMEGDLSGGTLGVRISTSHSAPIGFFTRFGLHAWEFDGVLEDSQDRGRFIVEGSDIYLGLGARLAVAENADIQFSYDYYPLEAEDKSMDFAAESVSMDIVFRF